eukprot:TRINITY_DN24255_c0_g1_i1.p1 TRINITY_DN24255_c0_g1~~TRINITY_DN24255_c0_g1_i1.p1  ORF type:complete len:495 (+),score=65.72 TRINITY_DN24255_c0_g1_i1:123-1487(+)
MASTRLQTNALAAQLSKKICNSRRRRQFQFLLTVTAVSCLGLLFLKSTPSCWGIVSRMPKSCFRRSHGNLAGLPGAALQEVSSCRTSRCARLRLHALSSTESRPEDEQDASGLPRRVLVGAGGLAIIIAAIKRFGIDGPDEFDPAPGSLKGRTMVITGGNTGLGKESAIRLARGGATVVITARTDEKGFQTLKDIKSASGSDDVHYLQLDLADLKSVKSFANRFEQQPYGSRIDVLMNNAGVMAIPERQETKDGFERQLGINHLGHFALVGGVMPLLRKAQTMARVINVSSTAHLGATKELFEGDLMAPDRYTQWGAYCQSKLANVLFSKELDRRFKEAKVPATAVSCHPGGVDTDLARWVSTNNDDPSVVKKLRAENPVMNALISFVTRSVQLGANTQVYLAAEKDSSYDKYGGEYFDNMAPGLLNPVANDKELARRLWDESEKLTGVKISLQ